MGGGSYQKGGEEEKEIGRFRFRCMFSQYLCVCCLSCVKMYRYVIHDLSLQTRDKREALA